MPSQLAEAQVSAQQRLRSETGRAVTTVWRSLESYDEDNVNQFLLVALPLVRAAQRQSVALTDAYIARILGRRPLGINPDDVTGARTRNGADPKVVYRRPFVTTWSALKSGTAYTDAVDAGGARATSTAVMDVQLASRATFAAIQDADKTIFGFQRVADGDACAYCRMIDGAYVKRADAMALHNYCGCTLEPLTEPHPSAARLPSGVAVHEHSELGPVLTAPEHVFTTL